MRQLIAGNWKMNGTSAALAEIEAIAAWAAANRPPADLLVCPPATLLDRARVSTGGHIAIGGQDCHPEIKGAYTGDVSAAMLKDAGATAVIVGHSERRQYHGETDGLIVRKAKAAWGAGLLAIICVGESQSERDQGKAHSIVAAQVRESVPGGAEAGTTAIAYEPVWAIGTGRTPTASDIVDMHALIRAQLPEEAKSIRILYGGSVKPENAQEILGLSGVDGALIGGASLKASDFIRIASFAQSRS